MGSFLALGCSLGSAAGQVLRLLYFSLRWRPVPRWSRLHLSLLHLAFHFLSDLRFLCLQIVDWSLLVSSSYQSAQTDYCDCDHNSMPCGHPGGRCSEDKPSQSVGHMFCVAAKPHQTTASASCSCYVYLRSLSAANHTFHFLGSVTVCERGDVGRAWRGGLTESANLRLGVLVLPRGAPGKRRVFPYILGAAA